MQLNRLAMQIGLALLIGAVGVTATGMMAGVVSAAARGAARAEARDEGEPPITGAALEQASAAALAYTGGGRVTETEVGDEDAYYEVEITFDDGRQVDVHLNEAFSVVGQAADAEDANDQD